MEISLLLPAMITCSIYVLFFGIEFFLTPFRLGNDTGKDKNSRYIVLGAPIGSGVLSVGLLIAMKNPGVFGWWSALGLAFMITGICTRVIAKKQLGEHFQVTVDITPYQRLVDTGIYAYIRHPLYLGIMFIYLALPFLYGVWWLGLSFTIPSLLSIIYRVIIEEQALKQHFGIFWDEHRKKTWWFFR